MRQLGSRRGAPIRSPEYMKRWVVTFAGFLVMVGPGAGYAYSFLVQPLIAGFAWNTVAGVMPFALGSFFFGIGAVLGGLWIEREDPRRVALAGIGLWAVGNTLSGFTLVGFGVGLLYFGYGVLGGLGCGAAYITALSVVMPWFPEKRGLGSGLATMGLGAGAFTYALALENWPQYATAAHMPRREMGVAMLIVMVASGVIFFAVGVWALLLETPPDDDARFISTGADATTGEMLRNPQFYLQWTMLLLNATGGIALTANAASIMAEFASQTGSTAVHYFLLPAIALGLGCIFWGMLSDRIGHRLVFGLLFGLQSFVFFAIGSIRDPLGLSIALAIVFFCFGGGLGAMPACHAYFFGTQRFSINYAIMLTAWGCAGLFAPLFFAIIKDLTGSYAMALQPIGLVLLVAIIFPIIGEPAPPAQRLAAGTTPQQVSRCLPVPHS
jgi:OFA family oxalate/formate antiporter-like MFS transporter